MIIHRLTHGLHGLPGMGDETIH